jgi:hypothetical protein
MTESGIGKATAILNFLRVDPGKATPEKAVRRWLSRLSEEYKKTETQLFVSLGLYAAIKLCQVFDELAGIYNAMHGQADSQLPPMTVVEMRDLRDLWVTNLLALTESPQERQEIRCVFDPATEDTFGLFAFYRVKAHIQGMSAYVAACCPWYFDNDRSKLMNPDSAKMLALKYGDYPRFFLNDLLLREGVPTNSYTAVETIQIAKDQILFDDRSGNPRRPTGQMQWPGGLLVVSGSRLTNWCAWCSDQALLEDVLIPAIVANGPTRTALMDLCSDNTDANSKVLNTELLRLASTSEMVELAVLNLLTLRVNGADVTFTMASRGGVTPIVGRMQVTAKV